MSHRALTVDLYVYAAHEVTVWEHLWWALRRRGVDVHFVVEPPGVNRAKGTTSDETNAWRDDKTSTTIVDLMDESMFERTLELLAERDLPWIAESRTGADIVVTTAGAGWLQHYRGQKVRTMYGVGAVTDSYGHGAINDGMDAVLVHGPFSRNAIAARSDRTRLFEVGFPKWSRAFGRGLDQRTARDELGLIDDGRQIVAWLPTWAQNSSIDGFADALAGLSDDYRVVAKPHHNNLRFEQRRVSGIDASIEVLPDLASLVPLVVAADIVVGDVRSGGVTEALLADRPVVGIVPSGNLEEQHLLGGLDEAMALCCKPADLRQAIESSTAPERQSARTRWSRWFFGEPNADDERAAEAIVTIGAEHRVGLHLRIDAVELDRHLVEYYAGRSSIDAAQLFMLAWPSWPGDPRLISLLDDVLRNQPLPTVLSCAREVRLRHRSTPCPIQRLSDDPSQSADRRLGAAALGSVHFGDARCTLTFSSICAELDEADLEPCLVMLLTVEPNVVPAFVSAAAGTGHGDAMTTLLRGAGVDADELAVLLTAA